RCKRHSTKNALQILAPTAEAIDRVEIPCRHLRQNHVRRDEKRQPIGSDVLRRRGGKERPGGMKAQPERSKRSRREEQKIPHQHDQNEAYAPKRLREKLHGCGRGKGFSRASQGRE